jgi:acyl-CoA thioesterase
MDAAIKRAIEAAVRREPFAVGLSATLVKLDDGYSLVRMRYEPERHDNIYARAHGGAIYGLIDEAFETASQTDGTIAVALNVNVTYLASPEPGSWLRAEACRTGRTRRTATFDIRVSEESGRLIATCQALAYRTGKPIPFL